MLKIGDKVIWGVVVPTLIFGFLFVLPYVEVGPSRRYGDRRIGLSVIALSVYALAVLSYMGSPWYAVSSSPDQEVVAALLPQTHPGPVRLAPWELLEVGTYEADNYEQAPNSTMRDLLVLFNEEIEKAKGRRVGDYELKDAEGIMIIEAWQTNLKKITLRVLWTDPDGNPAEFSDTVYIHRSSEHEVTTKYGG